MSKLYNVSPHALVVPSSNSTAQPGESINVTKDEAESLLVCPDWSEKAPAKTPAPSPTPQETSAESENKED